MSAWIAHLLHPSRRSLWIAAFGLVLLPPVLLAAGLTWDNATVVVILAMTAMALNLLVGYTGRVSFTTTWPWP